MDITGCGGCRARSKAMDSGFIPVGVRRFESGPPHIYIELVESYSQINSRPGTFRKTGSLEISVKLLASASATINLSSKSWMN